MIVIFDLGLVAVEQDDGDPLPRRRLVALPFPTESALDRTGPNRLLFEDDLVRSPGDGGIVPEGEAPGDLVQMDTLQILLQSDDVRYQYSARDAISRWDCSHAYRRATSFTAAYFLEYEEFYEVEDIAIRLDEHNQQLERWNQTYNYLRPHQSLAQLTLNIIETGLNAIKLPGVTNVLDEYIGLTSHVFIIYYP